MNRDMRCEEIIKKLSLASSPVSATTLAKDLGVSRQVIVQDITLLRALGYEISSLARGYALNAQAQCKKVLKTIHSDEDVEAELNIIVDFGGICKDVFIFHKVYGTVKADLNIKSRKDVMDFIENIKSGKSSLLKNVTGGYHYHTIFADNTQTLDLIENALWEKGFLAKLQEYEPNELMK